MTHSFCTLFDANYLPRGLALYRSLERTSPRFRLWVFCMDDRSERTLRRLNLPGLTIVPLEELERHDQALLGTKTGRTQVEYCWTATPAVCRYVLETEPEVDAITYLDADLMFFSDPQPLFDELGDDAVLIVPHRYAPEHQHREETSGTYNVEWLTFRRDRDGLAALHWWHDRCIEWCYFRYEDGKMGDQKYLDDWLERFQRVHVLEHPGGGLAPWNVTNHRLEESDGKPMVDGRPLVFFHFHSLHLYRRTRASKFAAAVRQLRAAPAPLDFFWRTNYPADAIERRLVWDPYLHELDKSFQLVGGPPDVETFHTSEFAHRAYRRAGREAKRLMRAADPVRLLPGASRRYRNSWRSADVARQMVELTDRQLENVEAVAPYVAFRELLAPLVAGDALPRPARILDIGSGAGAYGELLQRWWPGRFEYVGADYSEEILAAARRRWPERRFEQKDVLEPRILDGYDIVLASALLDVLPEIEPALDALLGADAEWVALHRQRIDARRSRIEIAPGYRGQHTYRSYITPDQLEQAARRHGRTITYAVDVEGDVRSFLLTRS